MLEKAIAKILNDVVSPVKVFPVFGTSVPCVTYTVTPLEGGEVKTSQVEVKSIAKTLEEVATIRQKIINKLDITDNKPSLVEKNIHLRSGLAGGGFIFNEAIQVWELSTIFIVEWRNV